MVEFVRVHGTHHQDIIRDGAEVRYQVTELHTALAVFLEGSLGPHEGRRGGLNECEASFVENALREALSSHLVEFWLRVEEI